MVELTRHAARQLYAPRRLAWTQTGVQQVELNTDPVDGLIPGARVETVPLGQWRSGQLYVTGPCALPTVRPPAGDSPGGHRGRWFAASAQHGRIGGRQRHRHHGAVPGVRPQLCGPPALTGRPVMATTSNKLIPSSPPSA